MAPAAASLFTLCRLLLRNAAAFLVPIAVVAAQCTSPWGPGLGAPGTNGQVAAVVTWDPDGSGPLPALLVCGGAFSEAGGLPVSNLATFEPIARTWGTLGAGLAGVVHSLVLDANNQLIAGGVDGTTGFVSRWNGTTWQQIGSMGGSFPAVRALASLPSGDLVAAGAFTLAGGVAANRIARWNGTAWSSLGAGVDHSNPSVTPVVYGLVTLPSGDLVAVGAFTDAGGITVNHVARWDGVTWSALGTGVADWAFACASLPNGDLVVGGRFTTAGGLPANCIARWNGTSWAPLSSGVTGVYNVAVSALRVLVSGDLLAAGSFTSAGGAPAGNVARFDGAAWHGVGSLPMDAAVLLELPGGTWVAGGVSNPSSLSRHLMQGDGSAWVVLGDGLDGYVAALARAPNGDTYVGGAFGWYGPTVLGGIARWNGNDLLPVGSGFDSRVTALATASNGDLIAAGWFNAAGTVVVNGIARWNGTAWSPLGSGLPTLPSGFGSGRMVPQALAVLPNGEVVVGGWFHVSSYQSTPALWRWDGTAWSPLATFTGWSSLQLVTAAVRAMVVLPNGDLVVGGRFSDIAGLTTSGLARWDGSQWHAFGVGVTGLTSNLAVDAMAVTATGDLLIGGSFGAVAGVAAPWLARWDGVVWTPLITTPSSAGLYASPVRAIAALPNGDVWLGGLFTAVNGTPALNLARLRGTTWEAAGSGPYGTVTALQWRPDGETLVGGYFRNANGAASASLARLTTSCPATSTIVGPGCPGSAGPVTLSTTDLPWLSATAGAAATGLPANCLGVAVYGLAATTTPLAAILPSAGAGCALFTSPDLLAVVVPTAGVATTALAIPPLATLVGQTLRHQVVVIELALGGAIGRVSSTQAVQWTIGMP